MYVYILRCNNGRYYIGSTPDIERRFQEHSIGKNQSTKYLRPVELIFYQKYPNLTIARKVENWLKRQKDKSLTEQIIKEGHINKTFE